MYTLESSSVACLLSTKEFGKRKNFNVIQVKLNQALLRINTHFTHLATKFFYTENHVYIVIISVISCIYPSLIALERAEFLNLRMKIMLLRNFTSIIINFVPQIILQASCNFVKRQCNQCHLKNSKIVCGIAYTECYRRNLPKERITELWLISPSTHRIYLQLHNFWYCFFKRNVKLSRSRALLHAYLFFELLVVINK